MTCYKRAKFHHKSVNTFRDLYGEGGGAPLTQAQNLKKIPGETLLTLVKIYFSPIVVTRAKIFLY